MKFKSIIIALFSFGAIFAIDAPQNLEAMGGDQQIDLMWDAVDGAASYNIYQVVEDGTGTGGTTGGGGDCAGTEEWIADGYCDSSNNNEGCAWDGGDCCESTCVDSTTYQCGDNFQDDADGDGCWDNCFDPSNECAGTGTGGTTGGGTADCEDCEFDWTAYGAECCDAAWGAFGVDCATLEANYGWDCAGCACPGDVACEDQGLITCPDNSCAATLDDCPEPPVMLMDCSGTEFTEDFLIWIGDGYCDDGTDQGWTPILDFNCEDYDFDGGDCDVASSSTHYGTKILSISNQPSIDDNSLKAKFNNDTREEYVFLGSVAGTEATITGFADGDEGCFVVSADDGLGGDGCEFDWTAYGAADCDAAWVDFGIDCATLELTYGWDCAGCDCPGDGAPVCGDGVCSGDETYENCPADCLPPGECADGEVLDCDESGECWTDTWIGDGFCDGTAQQYGADLCCFDNDGGDCTEAECTAAVASSDNGLNAMFTIKETLAISDENNSNREESGYSNEACATASSCATGGTGDVNADMATNVLDIVQIVNYILGSVTFDECQLASADLNGDAAANVLDIVAIVNLILDGRSADASSARLIDEAGVVSIDADGYVGAVQMTLTHGADFSINLTDKAMVADFATNGNTTTLVVVAPETNQIFISNGEFEISEMIVANSTSEINVVMATEFSLMAAYPNPFNPSTTLSLNMPEDGFVSVKVFNLMGQAVATLTEGNVDANTYSFTWNASDMPSGMYMVRAEAMGQVSSQKLMLLK